jgi:ABC-type Fe3+-hydroxamate transport system substrate-binding protein
VNIEILRNRPGWSNLAAVRDSKIFYVDSGIEEASPVAINALEELAREFHP